MNTTRFSYITVALFALFAGAFLLFPQKASASTMAYNPNNIIRDDIFLNTNTMSATDIQNFLTSKGSCLATVSPSRLGPGQTQTAAQIIYTAALAANHGAGINPQVILVLLQKEQSLITKSCAQLDAGLGSTYALDRAVGYNVPDVLDVGNCLYTFSAQMLGNTCDGDSYMSAPSSLRYNFDHNSVGKSGNYPFPKSFSVPEYSDRTGNITISPVTKATSLLYRYTPYAYYGNYNFFTIFQLFFGSPTCSTNLNVIHNSATGGSAVLYKNTRYPISSLESLRAWGLDCPPAADVSASVYNSYAAGSLISRVFKNSSAPEVYIVQNGVRRHISTSLYAGSLKLDKEPIGNLPSGLIQELPEGPPMGFLVKASNSPKIYFSQLNKKYYVPNIPTLEAWGFQLSELVTVNPAYLNNVPTAGNLSTLVKGSGINIFVASLHNFVYAPSTSRLADWNMEGMSVTLIDDAYLNSLPKRGDLSRLTRGTGPDTYYIENRRRYYVKNLSTSVYLEQLYGALTPMSDTAISALPYVGVK